MRDGPAVHPAPDIPTLLKNKPNYLIANRQFRAQRSNQGRCVSLAKPSPPAPGLLRYARNDGDAGTCPRVSRRRTVGKPTNASSSMRAKAQNRVRGQACVAARKRRSFACGTEDRTCAARRPIGVERRGRQAETRRGRRTAPGDTRSFLRRLTPAGQDPPVAGSRHPLAGCRRERTRARLKCRRADRR